MSDGKRSARLLPRAVLGMGLFLGAAGMSVPFAQMTSLAPLTTEQVVHNLVERNEQRARALESYRGKRVYQLEYHGLGTKNAELVVAMTYRRPDEKTFCVLSESGSDLLQGKVLKRLLEAEVEAMQENHRRVTAMDPENYEFSLVAFERIGNQDFYVLEVKPRIKNKFLFRGRIWVEGRDFAVARMEVEPAKNPSWWTKRNIIQVTYQKIGEFWLPARNETNTQVRILGRSYLTIVYQDYEILNGGAVQIVPVSRGISRCPAEPAHVSEARP